MDRWRKTMILAVAALFAFSCTLTLPAASLAEDEESTGLGIARVSYLDGDVLFQSKDVDEWAAVSPNFPLRDGDGLWAGEDSKLEIRFGTGETAWLNYKSGLDILKLEEDRDGNTFHLGLPYGEASFSVKNFEVLGSVFQVDTPSASIRAFGRALFRVTSLGDGTTQVGVREGSVEVESEDGIANVYRGELIEVYEDGSSSITDLPDGDDWDGWVEARIDRRERRTRSAKYLPREMYSYADEFDEGGRWVSYPEYGHVWVPTVAVDWSPYSYGRWVWVGYDYVWLPYDPWYAPYHYGRWSWSVSLGWYWVPPLPGVTYWSPGYVGWVWTDDYVCWVPLAPGEIYYGYGYFGPTSVNVYRTTTIINRNVYRNRDVRNGVVVVERHRFIEGKTVRSDYVKTRVRDVFSEKIRHRGFAPVKDIKRSKKTRLPRPDREIHARDLPEKKFFDRADKVKKRRVVRGENKSAFSDARERKLMRRLERIKAADQIRQERTKWRDDVREQRQERREDIRKDRLDRREDIRDQRQERREDILQQRDERRDNILQPRQERREDILEKRQDRREEIDNKRQQKSEDALERRQDRRDDINERRQDRTQQREDKRSIEIPGGSRERVISPGIEGGGVYPGQSVEKSDPRLERRKALEERRLKKRLERAAPGVAPAEESATPPEPGQMPGMPGKSGKPWDKR